MSSLFPTRDILIELLSEFSYTLSSQSWILSKVSASVISYTKSIPWTPLKYCVGIVLYFSWPAVSQTGYQKILRSSRICLSFICLFNLRISIPTVMRLLWASNLSWAYRVTKLVFPTFDYPSSSIFITTASRVLSG